ncbi:bone morphogenetic protein 2-like [Penaeus indicus]|uniref:bone morphogenetic protein 2-like n=1 Tax=Penaeus indicus TaxID=29960 RepID=UPI00300CFACF
MSSTIISLVSMAIMTSYVIHASPVTYYRFPIHVNTVNIANNVIQSRVSQRDVFGLSKTLSGGADSVVSSLDLPLPEVSSSVKQKRSRHSNSEVRIPDSVAETRDLDSSNGDYEDDLHYDDHPSADDYPAQDDYPAHEDHLGHEGVRAKLLAAMGLSSAPSLHHGTGRGRHVPEYMWSMYRQLVSSPASCSNTAFVSVPNLFGDFSTGCHAQEIFFDLSRGEEAGHNLQSAHLHVELPLKAGHKHKKAAHSKHAHKKTPHHHLPHTAALLEVTLAFLDNTTAPRKKIITEGEDAVFDVTSEAQAWSNGSGPRVAVTVRPLTDVSNTEHHREDVGCSSMKWEASLMVAWDDTSACSSQGELSYPPQGLQKDEDVEEEEEDEEEEDEVYEDYFGMSEESSGSRVRRGAHGANKKGRGKKTCKLRSMYVNFREIGWNSWIIAPTGYEAGSCYGRCTFPLQSHNTATNHAVVAALRRELQGRGRGPSCVPTRLEAISLLYYDEANNVVLKQYPDMVAKSCGCR